MNIHIDSAIYALQQRGGISKLWTALLPELRTALPDATFDNDAPPDLYISTYYQPAPLGVKSLALVYDCIALKYPNIDSNRADVADMRRAVAEASAIVSISKSTAADVQRYFGRDSVVAYPGVNQDMGKVMPSAVDAFRRRIGAPYVLVVGNRGLYKNVQSLYQAWGLWPAHEQYKLLCVGGEDMLPQDAAFDARYPGVRQRVVLDDTDMALAYAGATCLVYPSLMEGFGLPLVEAMICGCPIVCDEIMREVCGVAGTRIDATIPKMICDALREITEFIEVRVYTTNQGINLSHQYTWLAMAATIADVIRSI